MTITTAEQIAARFGNDGTNFTDAADQTIQDVCQGAGSSRSKARSSRDDDGREYVYTPVSLGEQIYDAIRYEFADGSAIVIAGDAWDVEGDRPFSWRSA